MIRSLLSATGARIVRAARGFNLSVRSAAASVAMASCAIVATGCTSAQKQTTLQVVTVISQKMPEVIAAADTVAATIAVLTPADAALIGVADTGFDAAAATLQALCASYVAHPDATVLAQIQAAVNALEASVNTATLNALGIKDQVNQRLALAALKGLLTVVTVVFGMIVPTEPVAMLRELRDTHAVQLARTRPYMDQGELAKAAKDAGVSVDRTFAQAEAFGF